MKKAKKSLALFISVLVFVSAFTAMLALADGTEVIWSNSFETEEERLQWSFIDSDGDGNNWMWKSSDTNASYTAYDGKYSMYSESRTPDREALFPDNISISEEITIKETDAPDLRISWFVAAQDFGRANEHYSVYVIKGLDSVDAIESYQPVFSETLTENVLSYHSRSVDITKTVDDLLDGTEEKTIRIVFRHYDVSDVYALKIDAVSLEAYYNYDMLAEYDFEDGLQGWTTIDGDGDGHNWEHKISSDGFDGYLSEGCIASASYGSEALYPENYIVSPEINISKKYSLVKLSWYDGAYNDSYFAVAFHHSPPATTACQRTSQESVSNLRVHAGPPGTLSPFRCLFRGAGEGLGPCLSHYFPRDLHTRARPHLEQDFKMPGCRTHHRHHAFVCLCIKKIKQRLLPYTTYMCTHMHRHTR